jgi:ATP-dependent helicase/nuclease subunit A
MKSSRKKTSRGPDTRPADWHRLEVAVPERSRLTVVAGGLPGREPPQSSLLIESIAAACGTAAAGAVNGSHATMLVPAIWLVAPSRRVGNEWIETLSRTGRPTANIHVTTLSALAYDIVAESLAQASLTLAPRRARLVAVEKLLVEHRDQLRSFTGTGGSLQRLAERVLHSLESLRTAGLTPVEVTRGLRTSGGPSGRASDRVSDKAHDLALLMDLYAAKLRQMNLIDVAGELKLAVDHARAGTLPASLGRLLVPDDLDPPRLEKDLLDALRASPRVEVEVLATDPPVPDDAAFPSLERTTMFRAAGESNEVRYVLRTCLRLGLRLDEVEVVHADASMYPTLIRDIVAALPSDAGESQGARRADHLPVTFADGLPLADAKPGRAVAAWIEWRRDGHPQSGLERMLRDGLIELRGKSADSPRPAALVRELRSVRIGRGLKRTVTLVEAAATRVKEQPADAFARGRHDDDDWSDGGEIGEEQLVARKQRHIVLLGELQKLTQQLADCEGGPEPTGESVLRGARRFIDTLCASESEFDGNARRLLLDEIDAMLEWQGRHDGRGGHAGMTSPEILDWLVRLPQELVVLGSGPRPGCLHVSSLMTGGHSGRPYTFVLGLDENRFPGGGATDPLLTDGERTLLNAAQPDARLSVAHDAAARNLLSWRRLMGRLRGRIWLGFSCRDTAEDGEVFPSPVLLSLFALCTGNPLAKVDDLLAALPAAETLVPADPEAALDETQWWLASLTADATPADLDAALAAHRGHLAHGHVAEAARLSAAFTPHDGHVPAAGLLLDPRGDHGRAASANSLEMLGACPRRFFFRYGLGVEPAEVFDDDADRWLNALDAGSLLHTVLERFMRGIIERAELPEVDRHLDGLLQILDEELDESRRKHPPLTELSFIARRAEMQLTMQTFLHDEERSCRETGLRPLALEAAIGVEPGDSGTPFDCRDPVTVTLAPGETIRLRGRIDRIDVRDDGTGSPSYALWDYKSGSGFGFPATGAEDPFVGGRKLQHGLYVVMLHERLAAPGAGLAGAGLTNAGLTNAGLTNARVERFGYFFPSRAGKGRRLQWTSAQLEGCVPLVRQLAEIASHGVFLPTSSAADCTHCDFATVCGDPSRVTRAAARKLATSEMLRPLFEGLRGTPRPAVAPALRRPRAEPLLLSPHPAVPDTPPDEPARKRIREDLATTLLVEAAAGTGKTSSMVDRMLGLVRTGVARPESVVAVTFTKKAAGELRRRFREKLQQSVATASDPVERERLAAALERIDRMVIGTIHSFAGRLLRERPIEAGVDPGFRELDEPADRLLRRQAWREFVNLAPTDHADLLARLEAVGLRLGDFSRLFLDRFATYGDVEAWPAPETDAPDTARIVGELEAFVADVEATDFPPPAERGTDELMTSLEQFARMFRRCDTSSAVAVMDLLGELDRTPKVTQKYWPGVGATDAEAKAACKAAAERGQAAWDDAGERIARPALWQWRAHRYPLAIATLQAALAVYDRLRAERGVLSFQDLLCKAAGLLAGSPDVRRSFRSRYTHILVDEFQDTDPVQAQLVLLLTASDPDESDWRRCRPVPGSLFVVGDPKQSLYRFRRADIVTYATVKEIIGSAGALLALTTNFRSRGDLVDWANGIFQAEFPPTPTLQSPSFTPSITGRQEQPATDGADQSHWLTGVRTLRFVRSGHAGDTWAEREAREIAAFIRGAIDAGFSVPRTKSEAAKGLSSACRPGDFLIIGRERRHLGIYAEALHAAGLPVDVTGTLGEDQAEPLRTLRDCLAVLADPDDSVATLALLRGAVFGFSDADLHAYKVQGGRFGGGVDVPAGLEPALRERCEGARDAVIRWRRWVRQLPVVAAIERVIDDAGLMLIAAAADGEAGPRGRAVAGLLQKYLETIRSDRLDIVSIHDCLDLLDDMVDGATRSEFDPLSIDTPSVDRVRVMNLHKAKGLEAPVVFLADYQCRDAGEKPEDGPFLHIDRAGHRTEGWLAVTTPVGRSQRIIAAPPGWPDLSIRERAFEAAEQIRLDYVAATRPGACLIVSLFEKHDAGTKTRPPSFNAEGAWQRFGPALADAADLPEPVADGPRPAGAVAVSITPPVRLDNRLDNRLGDRLRQRIATCCQPTFARISPREVLTEPAEGIRFTGHGLGEPWGRVIHCLLEVAAGDPGLDLEAAAATALSAEDVSPVHLAQAVTTVRSVMQSDVWRRSQASGQRYVEVPFSLQVRGEDLPENVRSLAGDGGPPLPTVVRGVIDLVFQEPGGPPVDGSPHEPGGDRWTVVDWKTDSVTAASESLLEAHYRPQVALYAECWSSVLERARERATSPPA